MHTLPTDSPIAESYRGLRSGISFSSVDTPLATLGVSSARAGEGKSTTAANLALAMAMDGRQVILVDADLRRPTLHHVLGLEPSPGLTDVLTGHCSIEQALQVFRDPEHHVPDLMVLTSGPIPPNPAELLNTVGMETVIRELRSRADIVLFDAPPCLLVTDAQVLGARLDGMLLVAEMGEARKDEVRHARELLDQAHIRVLGVVFNKAAPEHGGHYYRRYSYQSYESGNGRLNGDRNGHPPESGPTAARRLGTGSGRPTDG